MARLPSLPSKMVSEPVVLRRDQVDVAVNRRTFRFRRRDYRALGGDLCPHRRRVLNHWGCGPGCRNVDAVDSHGAVECFGRNLRQAGTFFVDEREKLELDGGSRLHGG